MKQINVIVLFVSLAFPLAGCVTTAQELSATSEHKAVVASIENYLIVYRNVFTTAKNCLAGMINLAVSNKVEGQLFDDLKFGEISYYMDNLADMHFAYAKVEQSGTGSKVSISTGSQHGQTKNY